LIIGSIELLLLVIRRLYNSLGDLHTLKLTVTIAHIKSYVFIIRCSVMAPTITWAWTMYKTALPTVFYCCMHIHCRQHVFMSPPVSKPLTNRGVQLSTLLHAILNPFHHLLNVLLQIANKLGLSNKQTKNEPLPSNGHIYTFHYNR
jgi:hypothetical protein